MEQIRWLLHAWCGANAIKKPSLIIAALILLATLLLMPPARTGSAAPAPGAITRVSVASDGTAANNDSEWIAPTQNLEQSTSPAQTIFVDTFPSHSAGSPDSWNIPVGLVFFENTGQFLPAARFLVRGALGNLWLADGALWITIVERASRSVNVKLSFVGANARARLEPFDLLSTRLNYFIGDNPTRWRSGVPAWGGVRYVDLYPGVDLEVSGAEGRLSWRLIDRQASLARRDTAVRLRVEGAESVSVAADRLELNTAIGTIGLPLFGVEGIAAAAQPTTLNVGNLTFEVTSPFAVSATPIPQSLPPFDKARTGEGEYEPSPVGAFPTGEGRVGVSGYPAGTPHSLTPATLFFSTFLGGSGRDVANGIARDNSGALYVTGSTASTNFPATPGLDTSLGGDADVFVTKLNATGSSVIYSTYLGGSYLNASWGSAESGTAIAVDGSGAVYVTGSTRSSDFPTTTGAFDTSFNGDPVCIGQSPPVACMDAFVVKLNSAGGLVYGTYLGGSHVTVPGFGPEVGDDVGEGIAVKDGIIYVTGWTNAEDFPTTPGAFKRVFSNVDIGLNDNAFIVKINPAGNGAADLLYGTYVGGGYPVRGKDIAVDNAGIVYVTGYCEGGDFPVTAGAYDTYLPSNDTDAFVIKFNPAGNGSADLLYATFVGNASTDRGAAIAVGGDGAVYVTGITLSSVFPTTAGAFMPAPPSSLWWTAFVSKFNLAGHGSNDLVYSTYLGGGYEEGMDIAVDGSGDIYVTGYTVASGFPTTPGAYDRTHNGYADAFVTRLRPQSGGASDLIYSTFLGGSYPDKGHGIVLGEGGAVYVVGETASSDFPTTAGAYDTTFGGGTCGGYPCSDAFVSKVVALAPTTTTVDAYVEAPALVGGPPAGVAAIPIQYGNSGATTATSVVFTATLGTNLTYVGDNSGITPTVNGSTLRWNLSNLALAASGQFALRVGVPNVALGTRYPVTLTIGSAETEGIPSNNTANLEVMTALQMFMPLIQR